jgi:hypothetical protein
MSDASDLWAAVAARYDSQTLLALTNIHDRSATTADATVGTQAAQDFIDLWDIYAQEDYDASDSTHVAVGVRGVLAILAERGGHAPESATVKWESVFGADGMIAHVRRTGPRSRQGPSTNSGVKQSSELSSGRQIRGWSDKAAFPDGILPTDRTVD